MWLPLADLPTISNVYRISQGFWRVSVQVGSNSHNVYCESGDKVDFHHSDILEEAWDIVVTRLRESVP